MRGPMIPANIALEDLGTSEQKRLLFPIIYGQASLALPWILWRMCFCGNYLWLSEEGHWVGLGNRCGPGSATQFNWATTAATWVRSVNNEAAIIIALYCNISFLFKYFQLDLKLGITFLQSVALNTMQNHSATTLSANSHLPKNRSSIAPLPANQQAYICWFLSGILLGIWASSKAHEWHLDFHFCSSLWSLTNAHATGQSSLDSSNNSRIVHIG